MKFYLFILLLALYSCVGELNSSFSRSSGFLSPFGERNASETARISVSEDNEIEINLVDYFVSLKESSFKIQRTTNSFLGDVKIDGDLNLSYRHLIDDSKNIDYFEVILQDSSGKVETLGLDVSISSVPDAPIAIDDRLVVKPKLEIILDVVKNDIENNNENLTISSIVVEPEYGEVEIRDNAIVYTADETFVGEVKFHYEVQNQSQLKDTAQIILDIKPNNPIGRDGEIYELPMRILFIVSENSNSANNLEADADFALKIMNDSLKVDNEYVNKYFLYETRRIVNNADSIMNTNEFVQLISKYSQDGVLTVAFVEDIPGGVLGIAHGIMCSLNKSGTNCDLSGQAGNLVVNEYTALRSGGGNCTTNPLGCTVTHELGHHMGYYHLTGERQRQQNYIFCPSENISYYAVSSNPSYTATVTDNNGKSWLIGPHAMRRGGGTNQRNGGFFTTGYKESSIAMFECYNKMAAENLNLAD